MSSVAGALLLSTTTVRRLAPSSTVPFDAPARASWWSWPNPKRTGLSNRVRSLNRLSLPIRDTDEVCRG
jgi:hypothetical protein